MIVKLNKNQYELIAPLIPVSLPNISFLKAVIYHNIPGDIWIHNDNNSAVKSSLIMTKADYVFILGDPNDSELNLYLNLIKKYKFNSHYLITTINSFNNNLKYNLIKRESYVKHQANQYTLPTLENTPKNIEERVINHYNIKNCLWADRMLKIYGNKSYLSKNRSICLIDKATNKTIAEAYSINGANCIEIGTVVADNYQRLGLSSYLCSVLSNYFIAKGLKIYWTCDAANIASSNTALKIGFVKQQDYNFIKIFF